MRNPPDPSTKKPGTYSCICINGTTVRFRRFTTIEQVEELFIQYVKDGWSVNAAAARAGLNSVNFTRFLRVRPRALEIYLDYINRHEKPETFIYE